ncbi:MAG: cytochrome b/b6 domain-containing protein [Anaerolineales bacterium]|nr:cytochrome b/b6 domain-containing protein [Anaerolineales bacterium]
MAKTSPPQRTYLRFALSQRIEHAVVLTSFVVLALTGLPQKYSGAGWAETAIGLMGGIQFVRVVHRVAATALMLATVFHLASVGYRVFVSRVRLTMLPGLADVREAVYAVRYNLGLRREPPQAGRYNFGEKFEYWALVWGTVIMIITGFVLWNPIAATRWLPGQAIPAAKTAHGGEALLAVLAIIIWHMYHVHVRHFNKSMFTGRMSEREMLNEHPRELADIKAGVADRPRDPAQVRRRKRRYVPAAAVLSALLLFFIYQFATFEQTALATVERGESLDAFMPLTATPLPTPRPTATSIPLDPVWADNLGLVFSQKCVDCHGGAGGLDLSTYAEAMEGGRSGPIIVPGDPEESLLVTKIVDNKHPGRLSEFELEVLQAWIAAGAPER